MPASAQQLYDWHIRPGALQRLLPPWQDISIIKSPRGVYPGAEVSIQLRQGPVKLRWDTDHTDFIEGRQFVDVCTRGRSRTGCTRTCLRSVLAAERS